MKNLQNKKSYTIEDLAIQQNIVTCMTYITVMALLVYVVNSKSIDYGMVVLLELACGVIALCTFYSFLQLIEIDG